MEFGGHGSANLNHQRSDPSSSPLPTKIPKLDFGIRSNLWPPDDAHNMLSFASADPAAGITPTNITFSHQDHLYKRGLSLNNGGGGGIRGGFGRMKGPFTPSQWMELEHQALIYKHLVANVPVPSHLLVPLRTSLPSYGSSFPPNFLGWGPFHHLGYGAGAGAGGSTDPEPGRCRRTDGKKWRCSRDAVPDQKYCERHINRGRHRSRKPVEANTTTAAAAAATTMGSTKASKLAPVTPGTASGGGSTAMPQHFGTSTNNPVVSRSRGFQGLSLLPPQMTTTTAGPKLKEAAATFSIQKPNVTPPPFEELSGSEFGLVLSDYSFLNPSERIPYIDNSNSFFQFDDEDNVKESSNNNDQHLVHQFIDDWPKAQSHRQSGPWSDDLKSDWTQLSMSIPVAPDFSSSSSSPAQEKSTMAIPRLTHMSLDLGEPKSSWLPVNWGKSMGGPLGEVLISTTTTTGGENLKWKSSPQMGSSPSGVLQKSNLVSLSNSSSASSPEAEKARLSTGFLDSALAN